jgi:hypothetical protein
MPIDPVGKGGGVPPKPPSASAPQAASPSAPFEAKGAEKAEAARPVGTSALDQLRAGKIDLGQYVEMKLDDATRHLQGLRAEELDEIRAMLRDKIVQDPHIADLVRQATGHLPKPQDE